MSNHALSEDMMESLLLIASEILRIIDGGCLLCGGHTKECC